MDKVLETTIFRLNDLKGFAEQCIPADEEVYLFNLHVDENIAKLKEFMKPKSCSTCKHLVSTLSLCLKKVQLHNGNLPNNFYCSFHEIKK